MESTVLVMISCLLTLVACVCAVQGLNLIDSIDVKALQKGTMLQGKVPFRLYKATKDGWKAADFHKRCDVGLPSIVCVKLKSGDIVGGYNPFGYSSNGEYRTTAKAFVFQFDKKTSELFICNKIGGGDCAILDASDSGPQFGVEALQIPLNPKKIGLKNIVSILGNDYSKLPSSEGSSSGKSSSGIGARRSGIAVNGNSLLGEKTMAEMTELEVYVDAAQL